MAIGWKFFRKENEPLDTRRNCVMGVRPIVSIDRTRLNQILAAAGNFSDQEIAIAMELIDEVLQKGEKSDYIAVVAEIAEAIPQVEGYACYGPTPLTDGVFDLYWIAVHPEAQGRGVGRELIKYVEDDVRSRSGRLLLIETSSREEYDATIGFYKRTNYELAARIKNYYRIGDDKLIFMKELR
jgi:ribosomal protein S18 acetylase RimI-like enzyme